MTTRTLATKIGASSGLISQLETGATMPSVATLVKLARVFNVPVGDLFETSPPATAVVRREARTRYAFPDMGVVDEMLSADPRGQLEVLVGYAEPGGGSGEELYTHGAVTEFVVVLSGELELAARRRHSPPQEGRFGHLLGRYATRVLERWLEGG